MFDKIFYKAKLVPNYHGLEVYLEKYFSVHETPCYFFCIKEHNKIYASKAFNHDNKSAYECMKERGVKIFKIHKESSRIAFITEDKAYNRLKFMKRRQLIHLNRDIKFIESFLSFADDNELNNLDVIHGEKIVPNTKELVSSHYVFD